MRKSIGDFRKGIGATASAVDNPRLLESDHLRSL